jgi:hypothetical protein
VTIVHLNNTILDIIRHPVFYLKKNVQQIAVVAGVWRQ